MRFWQRTSVTFLLHRADLAGGTERATFLLARELARDRRFDVDIVGLERIADEPFFARDLGTPLTHLVDERVPDPQRRPSTLVKDTWLADFSVATDVAVRAWFDRSAPDIVVTTTPGLLALAVQLAPARTRIVVVEHRATQTRVGSAEPLILYGRDADAVVSLSPSSTQWWREKFGQSAPRLDTIPNMLPLDRAPRSALRRPTVLAVGRLVPSKQFEVIVDAFARTEGDQWRLRIVGDGPRLTAVRQAVRRHGLCERVDLIAAVPDMATEYAKAAMLVMASRAEGQPLVALEAQRAGVPVVAFDCPVGTSSVVTHERNGLLVELDDVDGLARAMQRVMDDDDLRRRFGDAAWTDRLRFAPQVVARQWADMLESVSASTPRRLSSSRVGGSTHGSTHGSTSGSSAGVG